MCSSLVCLIPFLDNRTLMRALCENTEYILKENPSIFPAHAKETVLYLRYL